MYCTDKEKRSYVLMSSAGTMKLAVISTHNSIPSQYKPSFWCNVKRDCNVKLLWGVQNLPWLLFSQEKRHFKSVIDFRLWRYNVIWQSNSSMLTMSIRHLTINREGSPSRLSPRLSWWKPHKTNVIFCPLTFLRSAKKSCLPRGWVSFQVNSTVIDFNSHPNLEL